MDIILIAAISQDGYIARHSNETIIFKWKIIHKALIDPGLATSLFMYDFPFKDNGLFITYAFLTPNKSHDEIEKIILHEYDNIINKGIDKSELERAIAQIRATVAFSRDGSYAVASAINEAIAIGDWTFYTTFMDKIERVKEKDIQLIAKKYLINKTSTTGWFLSRQVEEN